MNDLAAAAKDRQRIDELVGEFVFKRSIYMDIYRKIRYTHSFYSSHPLNAWRVVDEMKILGWRVSVTDLGDEWNCRFTPADTAQYVYAVAKTPELAICLAALRALNVDLEVQP